MLWCIRNVLRRVLKSAFCSSLNALYATRFSLKATCQAGHQCSSPFPRYNLVGVEGVHEVCNVLIVGGWSIFGHYLCPFSLMTQRLKCHLLQMASVFLLQHLPLQVIYFLSSHLSLLAMHLILLVAFFLLSLLSFFLEMMHLFLMLTVFFLFSLSFRAPLGEASISLVDGILPCCLRYSC